MSAEGSQQVELEINNLSRTEFLQLSLHDVDKDDVTLNIRSKQKTL